MIARRDWTRRAVLSSIGTGFVGLAGCQDDGAGPAEAGDGETDATTDAETAPATEATEPESDHTPTAASGSATAGTAKTENTMVEERTTEQPGGTSTPELDLREANVTEVMVESTDGSYDFAVTLYHDDDGEEGYANWWQVETLDGERLGRRELLHAHSTDPFTRSETIQIPDGISCVVVRGHDQTHEYGGQAMLVDVETGETRTKRQGGDRTSVTASDCP